MIIYDEGSGFTDNGSNDTGSNDYWVKRQRVKNSTKGQFFFILTSVTVRYLLRFYPFFFTNTVQICLLKKSLLVSIFIIQCN